MTLTKKEESLQKALSYVMNSKNHSLQTMHAEGVNFLDLVTLVDKQDKTIRVLHESVGELEKTQKTLETENASLRGQNKQLQSESTKNLASVKPTYQQARGLAKLLTLDQDYLLKQRELVHHAVYKRYDKMMDSWGRKLNVPIIKALIVVGIFGLLGVLSYAYIANPHSLILTITFLQYNQLFILGVLFLIAVIVTAIMWTRRRKPKVE